MVVTPDEPFDNVYQARESCLQGHADLVTIENATVEEFIFSLILNQVRFCDVEMDLMQFTNCQSV